MVWFIIGYVLLGLIWVKVMFERICKRMNRSVYSVNDIGEAWMVIRKEEEKRLDNVPPPMISGRIKYKLAVAFMLIIWPVTAIEIARHDMINQQLEEVENKAEELKQENSTLQKEED